MKKKNILPDFPLDEGTPAYYRGAGPFGNEGAPARDEGGAGPDGPFVNEGAPATDAGRAGHDSVSEILSILRRYKKYLEDNARLLSLSENKILEKSKFKRIEFAPGVVRSYPVDENKLQKNLLVSRSLDNCLAPLEDIEQELFSRIPTLIKNDNNRKYLEDLMEGSDLGYLMSLFCDFPEDLIPHLLEYFNSPIEGFLHIGLEALMDAKHDKLRSHIQEVKNAEINRKTRDYSRVKQILTVVKSKSGDHLKVQDLMKDLMEELLPLLLEKQCPKDITTATAFVVKFVENNNRSGLYQYLISNKILNPGEAQAIIDFWVDESKLEDQVNLIRSTDGYQLRIFDIKCIVKRAEKVLTAEDVIVRMLEEAMAPAGPDDYLLDEDGAPAEDEFEGDVAATAAGFDQDHPIEIVRRFIKKDNLAGLAKYLENELSWGPGAIQAVIDLLRAENVNTFLEEADPEDGRHNDRIDLIEEGEGDESDDDGATEDDKGEGGAIASDEGAPAEDDRIFRIDLDAENMLPDEGATAEDDRSFTINLDNMLPDEFENLYLTGGDYFGERDRADSGCVPDSVI